jgi:hypothetical protein
MQPTTFDVVFPLTVLLILGVAIPSFMVGAYWFINKGRKTWESRGNPTSADSPPRWEPPTNGSP